MIEEPHYLVVQEVARRLHVSVRRVRQIEAKDLPYVQHTPRGKRAYDPRDLEQYLERRKVRS